jgi:hypothetical protein
MRCRQCRQPTAATKALVTMPKSKDTSKTKDEVNIVEQGETANIKQNTTNAGFFKGRRVK